MNPRLTAILFKQMDLFIVNTNPVFLYRLQFRRYFYVLFDPFTLAARNEAYLLDLYTEGCRGARFVHSLVKRDASEEKRFVELV